MVQTGGFKNKFTNPLLPLDPITYNIDVSKTPFQRYKHVFLCFLW